jgi:membrane protein
MSWITKTVSFLHMVARGFFMDECPMMAAALAYYALFALPPLLVLSIQTAIALALGQPGGEEAIRQFSERELSRLFGPGTDEQISRLMANVQISVSGGWAATIGTGILVAGATGLMLQLQSALNRVWDVRVDENDTGRFRRIILKRAFSLAIIMGMGSLLWLSLVLTTTLNYLMQSASEFLPDPAAVTLTMIGNILIMIGVLTLLLAALFRWLPDVSVDWSDVWLGAGVSAVMFVLGKDVLAWYLSRRDLSGYGAAGAVMGLLIWVYYSTLVLLLGAECAHVVSQRRGHQIRPEPGSRLRHSDAVLEQQASETE